MPGLADIFNDRNKLQAVSQFLLNFGQGVTQANSQGLAPLASLSYGFGAGGQGIQQLQQQRAMEQDRRQMRDLRALQIQKAQQDLNAQPGFSDKYEVINGKVIDKNTLKPIADFSDPNTAIARVPVDNQGTYESRIVNKGTGETVAVLGRGRGQAPTTNLTVNTAENALAKGIGTKASEELFTRRNAAQDAVASVEANKQAMEILNQGVITGPGADFRLEFGKVLQKLGINYADDAIANTEAFSATRAKEIGRIIKLFGSGTGLSDADREYASKAAAGEISMNEASIRKILEISNKQSKWVIERYNQDASKVDPKLSPFPLTIDTPNNFYDMPKQPVVPPPEGRTIGGFYQTPKGKAMWTGEGWILQENVPGGQ